MGAGRCLEEFDFDENLLILISYEFETTESKGKKRKVLVVISSERKLDDFLPLEELLYSCSKTIICPILCFISVPPQAVHSQD